MYFPFVFLYIFYFSSFLIFVVPDCVFILQVKKPASKRNLVSAKGKKHEASAKVVAKGSGKANSKAKPKAKSVRFKDDADFMGDDSDDDTTKVSICSLQFVELVVCISMNCLLYCICTFCCYFVFVFLICIELVFLNMLVLVELSSSIHALI